MMKFVSVALLFLGFTPVVSAQIGQETVQVQNFIPVGHCDVGPLIKVSNTALYQCVANVWTLIGPNGGPSPVAPFPSTNGLVFNTSTTASRTATLSDVTTLLGGVPLFAGNNLSDLGSAASARANLGQGTAATANIGTSGAVVPFLSSANAWSGAQSFNALAVTTLQIGTSAQAITGIQGTTGERLAAVAGPFVTGNVRITGPNGDEVDGGVPGGTIPYPSAGVPCSTGTVWCPSYPTTGTGNVVLSNGGTLTGTVSFAALAGGAASSVTSASYAGQFGGQYGAFVLGAGYGAQVEKTVSDSTPVIVASVNGAATGTGDYYDAKDSSGALHTVVDNALGLHGNSIASHSFSVDASGNVGVGYTGALPLPWPLTVGTTGQFHTDAAGNVRGSTFNGVGLTTSGSGTQYLNGTGTYSTPPTGAAPCAPTGGNYYIQYANSTAALNCDSLLRTTGDGSLLTSGIVVNNTAVPNISGFFYSAQPTGSRSYLDVGVINSDFNRAQVGFQYNAVGSATNQATIGVGGGTALLAVDGAGNATAMTFNGAAVTSAGAAATYLDGTGHYSTPAGGGGSLGGLSYDNQTGAIPTTTICTPANCPAGMYNVSYTFTQEGTPCTVVSNGWVAPTLSWTDPNGVAHNNKALPVRGAIQLGGTVGFDSRFFFQTTTAMAYGDGQMTVVTNGSGIVMGGSYASCTTGTGTYRVDATVNRVR